MSKQNVVQMALIHAIKKKIEKDVLLCSKEVKKHNTWKCFRTALKGKKLVVYGAGEMFDYFYKVYGQAFEICYAVDKNVKTSRYGIAVHSVDELEEDSEALVVLVTVVNGIDEIIHNLKQMGIPEVFSLAVMEYHRPCVFMKVVYARINRKYTQQYQMYYEIQLLKQKHENLVKRINEIQKRQTERYLYLQHTNQVLNVLIDKTDDIELKKEQMRYLFTEIFENAYEPDFDHPKTYNEKVLAMTLYDHNPLYTEIADKYSFKKYVTDRVGDKYVVPLLGVWDKPEDVDFKSLPERFVLKSTLGGDSKKVILIKDKASASQQLLLKTMQSWYGVYRNDYYANFNWQFRNIKQRIIAEELLDIEELLYYDFKVHCFHGEPRYIHVVYQKPHELAHYDTDWHRLSIEHGYPDMHCDVPRPACLKEMLDISRKLSKEFSYIRVDFYVLRDKLYVGELTLTSMGGLKPFEPVEVDYEWGDLI